jgi:uncharacterized protein (TIGR03083 family)
MAKQKSKAELLDDIQAERRRLEAALDGLDEMDMTRQGVVGEWSVKDVLAHLVAWERLFLSWYESGLQGRVPDTDPVGMSGKAIDTLNQGFFDQYRQYPLEEVLAELQASYRRILAVVQVIPEEDLFTKGRFAWTGNLALADYVAGNTCNHYRWAKTQIRKWVKNKNGQ